MTTISFSGSCHCGCPGSIALANAHLESWQALIAAGKVGAVICESCGCEHALVDTGSSIAHTPNCTPRIDSITPATGPAVGGTIVTITGHCLDEGTLKVVFGSAPGTNIQVLSETTATVTTPAGQSNHSVPVIVSNENGILPAKVLLNPPKPVPPKIVNGVVTVENNVGGGKLYGFFYTA